MFAACPKTGNMITHFNFTTNEPLCGQCVVQHQQAQYGGQYGAGSNATYDQMGNMRSGQGGSQHDIKPMD